MKRPTKHTPGPWTVDSDMECVVYKRGTASGVSIDSIAKVYNTMTATGQANEQLIAAAPELLTQLQACLHVLERRLTHPNEPDVTNFDYIKSVIAKATGGAE